MAAPKYIGQAEIIAILKGRQGTMTDAEYAKSLGVSRQFVSDVIRGYRGPSKEVLDSIGMTRVILYRRKRSGE
jgi:hypothetical protein